MFADVRNCLQKCIYAFLHFCTVYIFFNLIRCVYRDLSESVGVNRLESVGGVWAGISKRNNKRHVASDVPRSFYCIHCQTDFTKPTIAGRPCGWHGCTCPKRQARNEYRLIKNVHATAEMPSSERIPIKNAYAHATCF